jgi:hypothetical protein
MKSHTHISDDAKKEIRKELLGEGGKKIPALEKLEEKELPSFTEQLEIKLENTFNWTPDRLHQLGEISRDALVALAMQYKNAYFDLLTSVEVPGEEAPATAPKEEVVPTPEPVKASNIASIFKKVA